MRSTVILSVLVVLLLAAAGALVYACSNLIKKVETYEEWANEFRGEIRQVYERLRLIDDQNLFEKDDDVGFVFSEILRITKEFDEKLRYDETQP